MNIRTTILILLMLLTSRIAFSQFTLSGELRPRLEIRDGYKTLPDSNSLVAAFVSQRSRIAMQYKTEKLNIKISFQDVRLWGDEQFKTDAANLGLYEAWAEFPLCDSLSLKLGKQEFIYDNERLLSNTNWQQLGTTHNAALLKYKCGGFQVDFAAAFNQNTENVFGTNYSGFTNTYKTLNYLWLSKKIGENLKISILNIADGYQKDETANTTYLRVTSGGIIDFSAAKKFTAVARGFYQTGHLQTGQEVAAYYGNADLSYTIGERNTILIGFEYISGTDAKDTANKKSNVFSTLYGTGHKFNGNMDYFTNMPKDTKGAGLVNPYLNFICKVNDKLQLRADIHYFMLQNNYIKNNEVIDKGLGEEADLSCKYDISKEISLMAGFSFIKGNKSLEIISGGDSKNIGTWGFAMITFKPTFYKGDKK